MLPPTLYYRTVRYRSKIEDVFKREPEEEGQTTSTDKMGIERRRARSSQGHDDGGDDSDIEMDENLEGASLFHNNETENVSAPLFGHARLIHGRGDDAGMAHLAGTMKPAIPVYVTIHRYVCLSNPKLGSETLTWETEFVVWLLQLLVCGLESDI